MAFEFDKDLKEAYRSTFEGNFSKSRHLLKTKIKKNAANGAAFFLYGQNAFFETVFAESPEKDQVLLDSHKYLINQIEKLPSHPFKRYALAELYMQHGMVELRQGSYIGGLLDLRKSYSLLERNLEKHPDFLLANKTYYILQAVLSNVPDQYKGLVEFFGYETDQYTAIAELDTLQLSLSGNTEYHFFRKEVQIYRAVLMHSLTDKYEQAYQIIKANTQDYKTNPVSAFIRGKIALSSKKTGDAIDALIHFGGADCPFPYINYDLANAYLYSLDAKCLKHFAYFIRQNPGNGLLNDTYLRLAWWGHIKNDAAMVSKWISFIEKDPESKREKDKAAFIEAQNISKTQPALLEARLTFDGGYYEYAIDILKQNVKAITVDEFNTIRFHYQLARLQQDMGSYSEAISEFSYVLKLPFKESEYFLPVSSFNIALIYENKLENNKEALAYYKQCLEYKNYPYASTYRYKSELAIERLADGE